MTDLSHITHDLSTARYFTDRIAVMYLGKIIEIGDPDDVIDILFIHTQGLSLLPYVNRSRER